MSYRRESEALETRRQGLEEELERLRTKASELDSLRTREAELARQLAETEALLAQIAPKRALPLLEDVRVASPCSADWSAMVGDERVRFCGKCEKHVFNLSAMPRASAETLLAEQGDACIRLYRRADGTVITGDCPVGVKRKKIARVVAVAAGAGGFAAAIAATAAGLTGGGRIVGTVHVATPSTLHGERIEPPPPPPPGVQQPNKPPRVMMGAPQRMEMGARAK